MRTYLDLLDELVLQGVLERESSLFGNFLAIDRVSFVRNEDRSVAYMNTPLYIGYGQTVSQPYTVAFMLSHLDVKKDEKILEIGYGSGWQTVILSQAVGMHGEIHATEIVPEVKEFGEKNIGKFNAKNINLYEAKKGDLGVIAEGPFNRIISGAAATKIPDRLVEQLDDGGTLVLPVNNSIVKVTKSSKGEIETTEYPGFVFVPLIV